MINKRSIDYLLIPILTLILLPLCLDNFKSVIDRCTHELLIRPDWPANMECVDLANGERSRPV